MNNRLRDAFWQIHAEEELKNKTREALHRKIQSKEDRKKKKPVYKQFLPAAVCILFLLVGLGGYQIYFTPVSVISIDINPSFELGVNRFERIVSVKSYNDDGQKITDAINVRFKTYTAAVDEVLSDQQMNTYLSEDQMLSIVVVDEDKKKREEMLKQMESCTAGMNHVFCHAADKAEVEDAHREGLSYGKYRTFLEIQALNPDITAEDVQGMTMRELYQMLELLKTENGETASEGEKNASEKNGAGNGHEASSEEAGRGKGHGTGYGNQIKKRQHGKTE